MPSLSETVAALARQRASIASRQPSSRRLVSTSEFGMNRGNLKMLTYAPASLKPKAALVVVLHGCTQTAQDYADDAGWRELADRYGFMVLCPEQQRSNNPNLCFNWFQPEDTTRDEGEPASIHDMILAAIAAHDLDPARVFITGLSAGGAMANVMLATYPELFAGGAIIAGLPYGSASNVGEAFAAMSGQVRRSGPAWGDKVRSASSHHGPWPRISIWQGDGDHTVKPEVADAVAAQWADVHGAQATARPAAAGMRTVQSWRSPKGETVVELHRIRGMGHGTPLSCSGADACGSAGAFMLDVGISSSMELARGWGLLGEGAQNAASATAQSSTVAHAAFGGFAGKRTLDVGEVINKALRTAGLMK